LLLIHFALIIKSLFEVRIEQYLYINLLKNEIMLDKRGQITAFIIIGIIMLFAAGILVYIKSSFNGHVDGGEDPIQYDSLKSYVEHCLDIAANEGLLDFGRKGFYYLPPDKFAVV